MKIIHQLKSCLKSIMTSVLHKSEQTKSTLNGKEINLTADEMVINSDYFQVDKQGNVTCQSLAVTGDKSYINLNDTFKVSNTGTVIVIDENSSQSQTGNNKFFITKNGAFSDYIAMSYDGFYFVKNGSIYNSMGATGLNLHNGNTEYHFADYFTMRYNPDNCQFQIAPQNGIYNVYVDGNVYANNISSDKNMKKNIKDSEIRALQKIKTIQHRSFDWIDNDTHEENGYIAQELEEIDPNFVEKVTIDGKEKYYLNLRNLVALSTKAIQELAEEVEDLKNGKTN